jgi:hypothetical protein
MFAWSLWTHFHNLSTLPLDKPHATVCPHISLICLLSVNGSWEGGKKSQLGKYANMGNSFNVPHLPTIYGKWTSGQYLCKSTLPIQSYVSTSDNYLLHIPVVRTRFNDTFTKCKHDKNTVSISTTYRSSHKVTAIKLCGLTDSRLLTLWYKKQNIWCNLQQTGI